MSKLWYKSLSTTPISKTVENYWYSITSNKIEKYRKWLRKYPSEKDLTCFSTE